ncbi:hypothetical protein BGZ60DRAFT_363535 [Tricladium varicosporioides]|nr:hypothetical protein BGZ60DRAFT_363535 [Hymenoscyphus varicosporioides]
MNALPDVSKAQGNPSKSKLCGVCNEKDSRYKCSRCYLPYCSIGCISIHKAAHPPQETVHKPADQSPPKINARIPQAGVVGYKSPFCALDESKELRALFKIYPQLKSQLENIYAATLPPTEGSQPELSHRHRKKSSKADFWDRDRGLQNGIHALNELRNTCGEDGEGVREFSRLILQIVSGEENLSAAEAIRKEINDENARIVSLLLSHERK